MNQVGDAVCKLFSLLLLSLNEPVCELEQPFKSAREAILKVACKVLPLRLPKGIVILAVERVLQTEVRKILGHI